jgi:hypothetical protein
MTLMDFAALFENVVVALLLPLKGGVPGIVEVLVGEDADLEDGSGG